MSKFSSLVIGTIGFFLAFVCEAAQRLPQKPVEHLLAPVVGAGGAICFDDTYCASGICKVYEEEGSVIRSCQPTKAEYASVFNLQTTKTAGTEGDECDKRTLCATGLKCAHKDKEGVGRCEPLPQCGGERDTPCAGNAVCVFPFQDAEVGVCRPAISTKKHGKKRAR